MHQEEFETQELLNVEGGAGGICFDYRRTRKMTCMGKKLTYYPNSILLITPTTSKYASKDRAWRLRAVPTFSESWSPVQGLCQFMWSAVAGHSRPFLNSGWSAVLPSARPDEYM